MDENTTNGTVQHTESELVHLVSDSVNRDLRRYPSRFNTENE